MAIKRIRPMGYPATAWNLDAIKATCRQLFNRHPRAGTKDA